MSQRIKSLLKAKEGPRWSLKGLPNKVDSEGNSTCKIFKFWMLVMLKKKKKQKNKGYGHCLQLCETGVF